MSLDSVPPSFGSPVNLQIDYARELNPQQHAAVTALPGPALVIAGAGAGKTRTLIYRVAFLLEQGIPADRILLLTFTNKAAKEMMRRVADLLGGNISALWGGTFHSVGNRILRRHAGLLGYARGFTILDREDGRDLIAACLDEAEIDLKDTDFPKADVLADIFSLAVNTGKPIVQILEEQYDDFSPRAPQIEDVGRRYVERKRAGGVMDFDDLLVLWLKLLREHAEIGEQYQRRFQFILVDEYQDTNKLQSDLIDLLAARHHNVMVVGDDSQSIYSWRGANFQNILQFPKRYPEARIYKIETNYRSTPEILSLANAAIAANIHQFGKQLTTVRTSGVKPVLVPCVDAGQQAAFVARRVLELREEGTNLNDMAVLYRSHFHALELQLELTRRNIPFCITSGIRFFEQAHIKDVAAYLKLVCNPRDELAFKRLTKLLPGIGGKRADKLWTVYDAERATRSAESKSISAIADALQTCASSVQKKAASAWAQFATTIAQLEDESVRGSPSRMIRLVFEASYEDYLRDHYTNCRSRKEDLAQLAGFSRQFSSTEEFLSQLALLTNLEAEDDRPVSTTTELLRLSTIHQAKGLEFPVIFIIMLCDGLFPSARSMKTAEDEEEERRLFYVAITRAKNELYLSYPLMRFAQSKGGEARQQRSRFLNEIPAELRDEWNPGLFSPYS
jgi:DNA helicase-2/ATP-dependent DNA helicase PcrA